MGVNGCKWICMGSSEQKSPLFSESCWKTRGFSGFSDDILSKKKKATPIGMTFLLVREAGLEGFA